MVGNRVENIKEIRAFIKVHLKNRSFDNTEFYWIFTLIILSLFSVCNEYAIKDYIYVQLN